MVFKSLELEEREKVDVSLLFNATFTPSSSETIARACVLGHVPTAQLNSLLPDHLCAAEIYLLSFS